MNRFTDWVQKKKTEWSLRKIGFKIVKHPPLRVDPREYQFQLTHTQLKEILARRISPELERQGFTYDGRYCWYGPWKEHCRKVVRVYLIKGAEAIFQWGLCFDFLPVVNGEGKNLRYQRTDKDIGFQLFCWPPGHWGPASGRTCGFSLFGRDPETVEQRLMEAFQEARKIFELWFDRCGSLSGALAEARRQVEEPYTRNNWPDPKYVQAFLLAANGRGLEGEKVLEAFFDDWEMRGDKFPPQTRDKITRKLKECSDLREKSG